MYNGMGNELYSILAELYRLNGKGTPPVFTTKGKALTDIVYEAERLDTGAYGTYPAYTSEGDLLDRLGIALAGTTISAGEAPLATTTINVPGAGVTVGTGTPTGTIVAKKFANRVELEFDISGPAAWAFGFAHTTDVPRPKYNGFFEHDVTGNGYLSVNGGAANIDVVSGTAWTWTDILIAYTY